MGSDLKDGKKGSSQSEGPEMRLGLLCSGDKESSEAGRSCRGLGTRRGGERDREGSFGLL